MTGERFTALPSNHPLGHYFDAVHLTGSYYTGCYYTFPWHRPADLGAVLLIDQKRQLRSPGRRFAEIGTQTPSLP